jgi:aldehyde dehydrogenase (NAD+)
VQTRADGTSDGLGGGLWTTDLSRSHRVAAALSFEAMHEYTQAKSVWINVDGEVPDWYGS